MPAEDSLRDAEYGLAMIEENLGTDRLQYHLKAFLTSVKSVFDYLLEDYNKKYSLRISEDEDLKEKIFEKRAKRLGCNEAQEFIAWWRAKKRQVQSGERCAFLLARHGKRDLIVHRRQVPVRADVSVFDSGKGHERIRVEKYEFFFVGFEDENAVSVCQHCLEDIRNVIQEARRKFPCKASTRRMDSAYPHSSR